MGCYGAIQWTSVTGPPLGEKCFLKAQVQTLSIRAEKDLRNHLSTPLILQVGKLRPGEVKDLVKITQLVRGKLGLEPRSPDFLCILPHGCSKESKGKEEETGSCDGVSRHWSVLHLQGKMVKRVYKLSCLQEVSHIPLQS